MVPEATPILYSFRRCPYAMRARLGLAISQTQVELREVKLASKPAELLEANPKGTVPVLILPDGQILAESLDILRWALSRNDPENWLSRDDPQLIARNDTSFKQDLDRYKYPDRYGCDPLPHRQAGMDFLQVLEGRLAQNGGQLSGAVRGVVDIAIMPFVRQFAATDPDWFAAQDLPQLQAWLAAHVASDIFQQIMIRPDPWKLGDEPLFFP